MKAIALGFQEIATGNMDCVLTGGTESMSRVPYFLMNARFGYRLGSNQVVDGMYQDGFNCPLAKMVMGATAENLAEQYKISREEQDEFALSSQQRAAEAQSAGRFDDEIVPVTVEGKKGTTVFNRDEHLFPGSTLEKLSKLAPVFSKAGTITAGNSSGITDGAAAIVLASEDFLKRNNLKPLAQVLGASTAGVDPKIMGIGPVPAIQKIENKLGVKVSDFDLVELNEAFAAQVLACDRELHFDHEKLNVNGGAIALGHPIGCTGTRIVVTLLYEMMKRRSRRGLATLCVSGGMGTALAIENCF
jgi:acetyl-CoA C-acetyltransferase